jgi:hypothetical protein
MTLVSALVLLTGWLALAADVVEPLGGKDLSGWKFRRDAAKSKWAIGTARLKDGNPKALEVVPGGKELINVARSVDIYTAAKFGDCQIELEVMVPEHANSGIYLMGNYEIQVLDSFGKKKVDAGDMGAVYDKTPPSVNASKAPGQWQRYVIDFRAPKFDAAGNKTANARLVKCTLNGRVIHENVEIKGCTGGAMSKEAPTGPLMFQGDHGPIAYRNIKIKPL